MELLLTIIYFGLFGIIAGVQLLEKLIEKHFDVYYRASYLYIRELRFEEVR